MPRRAEPDPQLPGLTTVADAVGAGLTPDQVRQRVRSGAWSRVDRGAYIPRPDGGLDGLDEFARMRVMHVHRAIAAAQRNRGTSIAYTSAALVNRLDVASVPSLVQLAAPPGQWTGRRSGIDIRRLALDHEELLHLRVPVTTPGRTWMDLTRRGSLADALVAGDSGLRRGILRPDDVAGSVERGRGLPGWRRVERALPLLSALRETPLESMSYAYFVEHRLPLPHCQFTVLHDGSFIARVDFLWEREGAPAIIGESDGVLKYGDRGEAYREKRREDQLRHLGYLMVRWGMADLRTPNLADRLRRALASA